VFVIVVIAIAIGVGVALSMGSGGQSSECVGNVCSVPLPTTGIVVGR